MEIVETCAEFFDIILLKLYFHPKVCYTVPILITAFSSAELWIHTIFSLNTIILTQNDFSAARCQVEKYALKFLTFF